MVSLSGRERLQPSLLDRLTDTAPTAKRDPPDQQALTMAQLRQAVLRDLAWLFNTTNLAGLVDLDDWPLSRASTVNYGIPGLAGMLEGSRRVRVLEDELTQAVRHFETRIKPETVTVTVRGTDDVGGMRSLVIEVQGELWAQPMPLQLFVETKIDVETRTATVVEAKPRAYDDGS